MSCSLSSCSGSPPRAWGQPRRSIQSSRHDRFTPTCVGTTTAPRTPSEIGRGSPPRAWGQLADGRVQPRQVRFTPTCVGTTPGGAEILPAFGGSPPRAWGQRHRLEDGPVLDRFTPTCVGTTPSTRRTGASRSVHPHVRGDNSRFPAASRSACGSPPRAWGQQSIAVVVDISFRFTPTCVGTTRESSTGVHRRSVHPHVRGDNTVTSKTGRSWTGSPPRAWGQLSASGIAYIPCRFTPTCVGTTTPPAA